MPIWRLSVVTSRQMIPKYDRGMNVTIVWVWANTKSAWNLGCDSHPNMFLCPICSYMFIISQAFFHHGIIWGSTVKRPIPSHHASLRGRTRKPGPNALAPWQMTMKAAIFSSDGRWRYRFSAMESRIIQVFARYLQHHHDIIQVFALYLLMFIMTFSR